MVFKFLEMVVVRGSGWYYQGKEGREKKGSHPRLKSEEEEPAQEEGQKCSDREKPGEQASRKLAAGHVPGDGSGCLAVLNEAERCWAVRRWNGDFLGDSDQSSLLLSVPLWWGEHRRQSNSVFKIKPVEAVHYWETFRNEEARVGGLKKIILSWEIPECVYILFILSLLFLSLPLLDNG